jgi:glycerol-3-phosphate dehydrogenase subunit B
MRTAPREACDVAVIGAGMAGMASSIFAADRGLSCVQVGNGGGILFSSGLLDLLAVHPAGRVWRSPWEGLAALCRDDPGHPLARVDAPSIRAAFGAFLSALEAAGLPYAPPGDTNVDVPTSIGTAKPTFAVPRSMAEGVRALAKRPSCLLVDFRGLREFSGRQVKLTLGPAWPGLRSERVEFPGAEAAPELYAAHVARALETAQARERVVAAVRPLVRDAEAVGFPAVLGLTRSAEVHAAFEAGLGVPVFEVPTMPTSVPGLRLQAALEAAASARGVRRRPQATVTGVAFGRDEASLVLDGGAGGEVVARSVVLATGRFTGRGLVADRGRVREAVLGLPVHQPAARDGWHRRDFLDPAGHPVNRAGLVVDDAWRPLDGGGRPAWPRLHAAGSILAHQDWMREKCGSGLAIATAWAAVERVAAGLPEKAG